MRAVLGAIALGVIELGAAADAAPAGASARDTAGLFVGRMTDNTWQDIIFEPGSLVMRDSYLAGGVLAREWRFSGNGAIGVELMLAAHWGEQDLVEISLPLYLRAPRPRRAYLPSLSYGVGLSWTSARSEVELDRRGETERLLAMWFIDLEFDSRAGGLRPFLRLHHRSDAFGVFPVDTGSNALVLGLRRDF